MSFDLLVQKLMAGRLVLEFDENKAGTARYIYGTQDHSTINVCDCFGKGFEWTN